MNAHTGKLKFAYETIEKMEAKHAATTAELRRLQEVNVELLALVKLVNGSFSGGRVMTFSEQDVEDFKNAIAKAQGETE
jgi:putative IMPACT (imprinted ancient) family translation regulator